MYASLKLQKNLVVKPLPQKYGYVLPRKYNWGYRAMVGMLSYPQGFKGSLISRTMYQCARLNKNMQLLHECVARQI